MTPFIEGFLIAFLAGVTFGWVNRKILKFKKMKSRRVKPYSRPESPSNDPTIVSVDVNVEG